VHGKATGGKAAILAPTVWQAAQDGAPLTLTNQEHVTNVYLAIPLSGFAYIPNSCLTLMLFHKPSS
jgi:hypothetical protein